MRLSVFRFSLVLPLADGINPGQILCAVKGRCRAAFGFAIETGSVGSLVRGFLLSDTSSYYHSQIFPSKQKVLDKAMTLYQGRMNPRCHLDSWDQSHALCRILTYPSQLTYASRHEILSESFAFDHALSSPFNNLHLNPDSTIPDSLCAHVLFLPLPQRFTTIQFNRHRIA